MKQISNIAENLNTSQIMVNKLEENELKTEIFLYGLIDI